MDRSFKNQLTSSIVEGFGKWKRAMDAADTDAGMRSIHETEDALVQLFLDTIEKAKPWSQVDKNRAGRDLKYRESPRFSKGDVDILQDRAILEFEDNLKKEIGK